MEKSRMKIAIIGGGISGLGAAFLLHSKHDITLYEKNDYIGGHSRTVEVSTPDGMVPVDTGFIVFNQRNYPLLTKLFAHLHVEIAKSSMSFGASIDDGWLEYGTGNLASIFAQKRNLLRPKFFGVLRDLLKFNKKAKQYLERNSNATLAECLDELGLGDWYRKYFLLPMGACIWSMPLSDMLDFPARSFIRFFDNHGLLTVNDQPQWYSVVGGSREYVARLTKDFKNNIRVNSQVRAVVRAGEKILVKDESGTEEIFDQVIFACHADQALLLIENPTADEKKILGSFRYQKNRMLLHSDLSFMPRNKKAWSSWVYLSENRDDKSSLVSLSYWMNNLQKLSTKMPIIVTLNPGREPDKKLLHDEYIFTHPIFDEAAVLAQQEISKIQGKDRLWFCGAYQRYGFHEDGLSSAFQMVEQMGIKPEWL